LLAEEGEAAGADLAGEVEDALLPVEVTHLADSPAAALVRDSGDRGDFLLVAEITAALVRLSLPHYQSQREPPVATAWVVP